MEPPSARLSSKLHDQHVALLAERGISVETATAAGLQSVSAADAKKILAFDPRSAGLLIPYRHPLTADIRTFRFRPDVPFVTDKGPAKYLTPKGVGNLMFFPPGTGERLKGGAEPIIFTEGEFKALAAWQAGLLCVGLTGVWGWKTRTDGPSQPVGDFEFIGHPGRFFTIVYDSDVSLNGKVKKARQALGKELYRRGAAAVHVVDLPATDGLKVGLDDFLAKHGLDRYLDLDATELPPTDIPAFLEPLSAILNAPPEPLEWAIHGIQPVGASGWRIAPPKVGKGWLMLEEAYSLATAQPLFGHFAVPQKRRVAIIEEEDPRRRLRHRLKRIIHAHGGVVPEDEFFRLSVKKGLRLDDPKWQEVLDFEIKNFRPELVYLDVFTRLHAKDVNDAQAMGEIVLFLDQLNRDHGAAFVLLHHDRKAKAFSGDDDHNEILGSRVLGGFAEASLFLSRTRERGVLKIKVALKDEPDSGFEPEFLVHLKDTTDGAGTSFAYLGSPKETKPNAELGTKALDLLTDWTTAAEVAKELKVSKPTARKILNALVNSNAAETQQRGKQQLSYRRKLEKPEKPDPMGIFG